MSIEPFNMTKLASNLTIENDDTNLEELPVEAQKILHALSYLHEEHEIIERKFHEEVLQLERKYHEKHSMVFQSRKDLINGVRAPTNVELKNSIFKDGNKNEPFKIQSFWTRALCNHPYIKPLITEEDRKLLDSLVDLRIILLESNPGFTIVFEFQSNDFFDNQELTKTYFLTDSEKGESGDYIYDHAVGTKISWKDGMDLCFKTVQRTQRHKNNNSTRVIQRNLPTESFFHFFIPPTVPADMDEEKLDDIDELEKQLQADYEIGEILKEEIIPKAIDWFTGKALDYAEYDTSDSEFYSEDIENTSSEEESSNSSSEEMESKSIDHSKSQNPECKQQ